MTRDSEKAATIDQHDAARRDHEGMANLARDTDMRKEEQSHRHAAALHAEARDRMKLVRHGRCQLEDAHLSSQAARSASTRAWALVDKRREAPKLATLTAGHATQPDPGTKAETVEDHLQAYRMHTSSATDAATRGEAEVGKAHEKAATWHLRAARALRSPDPAVRASGVGYSQAACKCSASAWAVVRTYGGTPSPDAAAAIRTGGAWRVLGEMFAEYREACRFAIGMALETEEGVAIEHMVAGKLVDAITVRAQAEEID